ncbi:MAG: TatD family nuclease-associated radical SAM protein [Myxococcaceae bacterium]
MSAPAEQVVGYTLRNSRYLNLTARCTLRCNFCPKFNGCLTVGEHDLKLLREPTVDELVQAVPEPSKFDEVVFCGYGEPTLRLDALLETAERLKPHGARIRVNTDGLANLVYGRDVTPELEGRVDALSISMNAQDEATYERHCRPTLPGSYAAMLDFAQKARAHVPQVTLTAIEGLEGVDIAACEAKAAKLGLAFRRRFVDLVG